MSDDSWAVPDDVIGKLAEAGRHYSAARPAGPERAAALAAQVEARGFGTIGEKSPIIAAALEQAKLSGGVSQVVSPMMLALAKNNEQSRMLSDQMKMIEGRVNKVPAVNPDEHWANIKLSNPAAKTNDLLENLSAEISRVTELSAQQTDIQTRQVERIGQLVAAFAEGSAAQDESIKLARRSMWIAVAAVVIGAVVSILVPMFT